MAPETDQLGPTTVDRAWPSFFIFPRTSSTTVLGLVTVKETTTAPD